MSEQPFAFHLRRDNPYEPVVTVRFEVLDGGMGVLGLRVPGRTDPPPSLHAEESNISVDALRAGRFVHVVSGGTRQSYALSRITKEVIEALPDDRWVALDAVTEYGFRYLVPPKDLGEQVKPKVQLQPVKREAVAEDIGRVANLIKAPRPASVAPAGGLAKAPAEHMPEATLTPQGASTDIAPRQVPVAPALAESALDGLSLEQARDYLKAEMAKVEALHNHAARLERELAASRAREADLLEVLKRWQSR